MIKGNSINLRHVRESDLESLHGLMNDPDHRGPFTRTLIKSPVHLRDEFNANGFSSESSELFVIASHDDRILGTIGHFATVPYSSARELGFSVFSTKSRDQGIATEAVRLITEYLFHSFPLNRVQICMPTGHKACEQVALKNGYLKEGVVRGSIFVRGEFIDTFLYSILRQDFSDVE